MAAVAPPNPILGLVIRLSELKRQTDDRTIFMGVIEYQRRQAVLKSRGQELQIPEAIFADWDKSLSSSLKLGSKGETQYEFYRDMLPLLCEPIRLHDRIHNQRDIMESCDENGDIEFVAKRKGPALIQKAVSEANGDWEGDPWPIVVRTAELQCQYGLSCPALWAHRDTTSLVSIPEPQLPQHTCRYTERLNREGPISISHKTGDDEDIHLILPEFKRMSPTAILLHVNSDESHLDKAAALHDALENLQTTRLQVRGNAGIDERSLSIKILDGSRFPTLSQLFVVNFPGSTILSVPSSTSSQASSVPLKLTKLYLHSQDHAHVVFSQVFMILELLPLLYSMHYAFDTKLNEIEGEETTRHFPHWQSSNRVRPHLKILYLGGLSRGAIDILFRLFRFPTLKDCQLLVVMPLCVESAKPGKTARKWREPFLFPGSLGSWTSHASSLRISTRREMMIVDFQLEGEFTFTIYVRYPFGHGHVDSQRWHRWYDHTTRDILKSFKFVQYIRFEGSLPTQTQWRSMLKKGFPDLQRLVVFGPLVSELSLAFEHLSSDPIVSIWNLEFQGPVHVTGHIGQPDRSRDWTAVASCLGF
ncbi:hypothetical protein SISNIDRAFT_465268 [Sistotremastrum niveocremeum HHB9708]|uniref:Uncharacterized protein n=1 Tax=Sistotremastrum niveocremeum HHB9708 TaxID=1314777 RepID=A0A164VNZ4_9AGAM|nr:hypothetical protein SISNIDRAFT_465268 [Sistotremastrum niveocremeum HHB9708]